jgi:predicted nuclease of predicted toxin-antitoxin system
VAALGKGATDADIYSFAVQHGAVLVTENARDFIRLGQGGNHPGMILLPSLPPRRQSRLLRDVITKVAIPVFNGSFPGIFIEAGSDGRIVSFK